MTIFEKILTNTLDRTYESMEKPAVMTDAEKIELLRETLRPFVDFYRVYENMRGLSQDIIYECHNHEFGDGRLSGEMFIASRRALEATK